MRILIISLLFVTSSRFAEFAKIVDADGYVNVRKAASLEASIVGRLSSGEFIYILDEEVNSPWVFGLPNANNTKDESNNNEEKLLGYIHQSRIERINQDNNAIREVPITTVDTSQLGTANTVRFSDNNVSVSIQTEMFDYPANAHKFTQAYSPESPKITHFIAYNGKLFWGTDGTEPLNSKQFKSITVKTGERVITIPKSELENLFNIDFYRTQVYSDPQTDSVYISASESHGAESYDVLFAIEQGRYVGKTVVTPF